MREASGGALHAGRVIALDCVAVAVVALGAMMSMGARDRGVGRRRVAPVKRGAARGGGLAGVRETGVRTRTGRVGRVESEQRRHARHFGCDCFQDLFGKRVINKYTSIFSGVILIQNYCTVL